MSDWNTKVIAEFRANGGKVGQFGDAPLVILNTIGAKSGDVREIPLVALPQGDTMVVFASAAGSVKHPDWFFNLLAHPEIDVEYKIEKFRAKVVQLGDADAAAALQAQAAIMPQFGEYITKAAPRIIPAFSITRL
jgi:deazaflavin-dependent oxidoreductase (nitroreductase family)